MFLNAKQCDKNNHSFNTYVGWLDYTEGPKIYGLDSESSALGGISPSHTRNDDSILNASKMNEHPHPIFWHTVLIPNVAAGAILHKQATMNLK